MCVLPSTLSAQLILAQSLRDCSPSQNEKSFSAAASFDYYSCKLRVVVLFLASSLPCASFIVVATTPQKREKKPCTTAEITFSMLIEKRRVLRCRKHCCCSHAITLHDEFFGGDRTFFPPRWLSASLYFSCLLQKWMASNVSFFAEVPFSSFYYIIRKRHKN